MKKVVRLAFAFLREHPVRVVLTSTATLAATCMVIWIASGYDAILRSFDEYANLSLGRYPLAIAPIDVSGEPTIPPEVLESLRADPAIAAADAMWARRFEIRRETGDPAASAKSSELSSPTGLPGRTQPPMVIGTDSAAAPFEMAQGRWIAASNPDAHEIAVRADVAQRLKLNVGDRVRIGESATAPSLEIVGIVNAPVLSNTAAAAAIAMKILTPGTGEFYVPWGAARLLTGESLPTRLIGVSLRPDVDITATRFGWAPRLSRFSTPVQFQESHDVEEALDETAAARNVELQAWAATGVAMLVAFLVIFCSLNMGITERIRQLAVLRAIVLTRLQVALLIGLESGLLATIGFIGGLLVSWGLLQFVAGMNSATLHRGVSLGFYSFLLAAVAVYGGAGLAALFPAWRATRVRPLDSMAPRPQVPLPQRQPLPFLIAGLVLVAVNPFLAFVVPPKFDAGVIAAMTVGFLCMSAGFVLLAPSVVFLVEKGMAPILARCFAVSPRLLASQLTTHLWRSVGAAVSMAVGMGLYIAVQVWGFTMLEAFIPGPWAPDVLIAFRPTGLAIDDVAEIARWPGVDPQHCLPIVVEQPRLLEDLTHSAERATVTRQDNVVLVGLNPEMAFGGPAPMFDVEWVAGSPQEAVKLMQTARGCIVPDHFLVESGLTLGDSFSLVPPETPDAPVSYTIAGAVKLPGWHWQTKTTGFRSRTHRAAAMVFADFATVSTDFQMPRATYVWFDYQPPGGDARAGAAALADAAQSLYADRLQQPVKVGGPAEEGASIQVMPVENIRQQTRGAAKRWLWILGQVPLIALLITSLGVLNVMLASVRARRWEMGVLRALGFSRGALVRTILAEGLLIGVVAAILSLGFGIMAGWCGSGFSQSISFFGGLHPQLIVPVAPIAMGLLVLLVLALLTAVWPALDIGRTRPLALLQKGRGSF